MNQPVPPQSSPQQQPARPSLVAATSPAAAPVASQAQPVDPQQATRIVFFCKDCEKIVAGIKVGRKYIYKCPTCSTKNVAFGTEKSVRSFYHVMG